MQDTYDYPLLGKISELFDPQKKSFENVYILACQHILSPQAKMFRLLHEFGIPKENIFIFGKIYSTSNEVLNALRTQGFRVSEPIFNPKKSFDEYHNQNCKNELDLFLATIKNPSKIIILDDGGALLKVVNDSFESLPDVPVVGIEQTSSGFRKLEYSKIHFPIFNVARSSIKLIKESPFITSLGCKRLEDIIEKYSILEPRILVVGLGPIGENMLSTLHSKKYFTVGYDVAHHDISMIDDLIIDNNINIVVGATGSNILVPSDMEKMNKLLKNNLYLVSMSSSDREFPAVYIRENGMTNNGIHDDIVCGSVVLVNNGFPVTFKGNVFESLPEEIERTIGLLYGSVLQAGIYDIQGTGFIETPECLNEVL